MFSSVWAIVFLLGYLATWILIPLVLLQKKLHPTAAVAWMLTILFLPYLGALLCVVFGLNRIDRHKGPKQAARHEITRRSPASGQTQEAVTAEFSPLQAASVELLHSLGDTPLTWNNGVEVLPEKKAAFDQIEQTLREAQESLHIEFYIWRPDETGHRLRDLLIERARDGVEVRFLYDGIGSMELGKKFLRPMYDAGIHIAPFLPGRSLRERWSINLRNHRKLIVADGQVAYTGGLNVGDEYLAKSSSFGNLRDTQIRVRGPAVHQMQETFIEDWYFSTGEDLTQDRYFPEPEEYGEVIAQVIADGPDRTPDVFEALIFTALTSAREQITLSNRYFIPPEPLALALETAARRGVQVRMMLARNSTFPWTLLAGRSYYDPLLEAGVEIYEYTAGLYHPKTLSIDREWALIGTMNFDQRSLALNFELGLVMYDAGVATALEEQFDDDLKFAERIDPEAFARRSTWSRLGENFWRLFGPIL